MSHVVNKLRGRTNLINEKANLMNKISMPDPFLSSLELWTIEMTYVCDTTTHNNKKYINES